MNIEHFALLSSVHDGMDAPKTKNHAQDGGTLIQCSASGDPAMVFIFRMASILIVNHGHLARHAQRPDCCWTLTYEHESCAFMLRRMMPSSAACGFSKTHAKMRAHRARVLQSKLNDECCAFR